MSCFLLFFLIIYPQASICLFLTFEYDETHVLSSTRDDLTTVSRRLSTPITYLATATCSPPTPDLPVFDQQASFRTDCFGTISKNQRASNQALVHIPLIPDSIFQLQGSLFRVLTSGVTACQLRPWLEGDNLSGSLKP